MLKIQKHKREDIPNRIKWLNNPNVNKFIGDEANKKTTELDQEKWFDAYVKMKNKIFFTIYDDKKPIGFMGLSNISQINKNAELFIAIGEDEYRGKGYGKSAFTWLLDYGFKRLKLHKLNLGVYSENEVAIKLYESFGFEIEGTLRDEVFFDTKFHDTYSMALFAHKYLG